MRADCPLRMTCALSSRRCRGAGRAICLCLPMPHSSFAPPSLDMPDGGLLWHSLPLLPAADVEAYVVQPIQRTLKRFDEAGQTGSVLLLGLVLTFATIAHPSITQAALTTLTRATVRTALLWCDLPAHQLA